MTVQTVAVTKYIAVFAVAYVVVMTACGAAIAALGRPPPSSINTLVLIIVSTCVALWFIRQQRRMLLPTEYWKIVCGCVVVDVTYEFLIIAATVSLSEVTLDKWFGIIFVLGLHALLIGVAYSRLSWLVRRYAERVSTAPAQSNVPTNSGTN